ARTSETKPGSPPQGGLLDVLFPWSAYTGTSTEPVELGRYGPVTPAQSSELLGLATIHPETQWRIILTDEHGYAQAVERFRGVKLARGDPLGCRLTSPVIGRLTVTIPEHLAAVGCAPPAGGPRVHALLRAAVRARARAGGADVSSAYRPSPRLREYVCARDITCTFAVCRQPAWRTDLDHTVPWHLGGPTASSNLGARCRTHHKIKQLTGWKVEQSLTGAFTWTTPVGNTYTTARRRYPI
ncbi:MAG: HNH endonuclease, partial [Actinobacteria bacterium]|nr:HNH endonuclease [Actinomycetota bacterium]